MAVLVEDREAVRPFLARDPIRNAIVFHRVFQDTEFKLLFADALPDPKAVLGLRPAESSDDSHGFALHTADPSAAENVLRAVPPGACHFHVADDLAFPAVRRRVEIGEWGEVFLFRMDPGDFRDAQEHETRPVDPKYAEMIAKIWEPEWPSAGYVRSRIEKGTTAGIYVDGELVAWNMTHVETDDVVVLGFLHVLDAHRGKGYAKSVGCALIKQALAKGKTPICHVYIDNEPSIRLSEELGFRRVCVQAWGDGKAR